MSAIVSEIVLEQYVVLQRRAIRYNILFILVALAVGIGIALYAILTADSKEVATLSGIGGTIITSLGGFRVTDIVHRKEKIIFVQSFQRKLHSAPKGGLDPNEQMRIDEVLMRIAEKTIAP